MEKKLTIKEIATKYNLSYKKVSNKIKQYDETLIKQGSKTCISESIVKSIFEQDFCEKKINNKSKKFAEVKENQMVISKKLMQDAIIEVIKPLLLTIENQNKIIAEISKRIEKIENQKSLPKPISQTNKINTNYEWFYPSVIAKHLECQTKWIYDALYQNNLLYKNSFTGKYQATEEAMLENKLKYFNGMLMINRSLINVIIKSVNIWKKNQSNLF